MAPKVAKQLREANARARRTNQPVKPPEGAALTLVDRGKPYEPTPKLVQMTPTLAEKILEANTMNRSLRAGRVERYASDMKHGRWANNGETVKVTRDGVLLDGQHRLWAVIESGCTVPMLVVEGLDPSVMPTIDTGAARGFRDALSIRDVKNATTVAGAARWLQWYLVDLPHGFTNFNTRVPTHSDLAALLEAHPDIVERVGDVASSRARSLVPPSILGFVYVMAYRKDAGKAGAWLRSLAEGTNLDAKHPVHQLRERMIANKGATAKLPAMAVAALTAKSWLQYLTGKRTNTLRWMDTEAFPTLD